MPTARRASVADVHALAAALPGVSCTDGRIYQVRGKSFVFFRTPGPTPSTRRPAGDSPT